MKTIKSLILLVIFVLSAWTGCSDDIISPSPKSQNNEEQVSGTAKIDSKNLFRTQIKIEPGQDYSLNHVNTGFYTFNLISILNCPARNILEITAFMDDELLILNCNSKDFYAKSISIRNLSANTIELDVLLSGSKNKIKDPGKWIKNSQ